MVDLCLAIDPLWIPDGTTTSGHVSSVSASASSASAANNSTEMNAAAAMRQIQRLRPYTAVNHTAYQPLSKIPIALSIEIKRPSGNAEEAQSQLGIWQFAHWRMLQLLASTKLDDHVSTLEGLDFLPGVYIVGHHWRFSATTRDGAGNVVQWIDGALGNTDSVHGIYCIVWGIRRIAKYIMDVYWPWFQRRILRMPGETRLPSRTGVSCTS
ncbi:hypothetical protein RB595_005079 [Gaeumannomyces hyphopodioides]